MATKTKNQAPANPIAARWKALCTKIEELAVELPASKLDWKPAAEIRSYGAILRHMAFWNAFVAARLSGETADDQANEVSAREHGTKKKCIQAFAASADDVEAALRKAAPGKAAELVLPFLEHNAEHYGQLSIHARLLGIVPPASRG